MSARIRQYHPSPEPYPPADPPASIDPYRPPASIDPYRLPAGSAHAGPAASTGLGPLATTRLHLVTRDVDTPPRDVALGGSPLRDSQLLDGHVLYRASGRVRQAGPEPDGLANHQRRYGGRPRLAGIHAERLLAEMEAAALTGRGGAHFPVARKWRTVLDAGGGGIVVANGAEGEPASVKDAALLQHRPHLVLDGIAVAVETLGATEAVLWLHEGAVESMRTVHQALAERRAAGLPDPRVRVATAPDHYLSGESSAVVRGLDGAPVLPAFRRVPAARSGVGGVPTLVQNVETLARVGLLARFGGHALQPGPLLTIVGDGTLTAAEVPAHLTLGEAARIHLTLGEAARIRPSWLPLDPSDPQAVLVGGFGGRWVPWSVAADRPLAHFDGRTAPSLGAGIVALAGQDICGIFETAVVVDYLADSSARQCGPCMFGTRELADTLLRLAEGRPRRGDASRLSSLSAEIRGRGACGMPDGVVALADSALAVFAADVEAHLAGRPCVHAGQRSLLPVPGRLTPEAGVW